MTGVEFRRAVPEDAAEVEKLNRFFNGEGVSDAQIIETSLRNNKNEIVYVAEFAGRLVGFCCAQIMYSMCYRNPYGEISEFYVMEEYRRTGIGRTLLLLTEECIVQQGVKEFRLLTGEDNIIAQSFYRSCGYEPEKECLLVKSI